MISRSYTDFVVAQSKRNPCLRNLCTFLAENVPRNSCRITSLAFNDSYEPPVRQDIDADDLAALLTHPSPKSENKPLGRMLIVEDLTKDMIELLGSSLDIDPLFFASHINEPNMTVKQSKPSSAILPSQLNKQNFVSLQYHGTLEFGDDAANLRQLSSDGNVPRKVVVLPPCQNAYIALAQHSCSVLLTNVKGSGWLGLVLADAPTRTTYRSREKEMTLHSEPFQGGYEDFLQRPPFSENDNSAPVRFSLLEDLVYFWTKERPPSFKPQGPDLLSLAYYPLKIVAAEWNCYIEVLLHSIKQYEYSAERSQPPAANKDLTKLDSDLRALQKWGRRCIQTLHKLNAVTRFVKRCDIPTSDRKAYDSIVEDYEYIAGIVETYAGRLEVMLQVTTSLVQIVDSRRSLREAENVTRLTNLALLFVPLSFVTGLFGMSDGISSHILALFFAVAVPLCLTVFLVAALPYIRRNSVADYVLRLKGQAHVAP